MLQQIERQMHDLRPRLQDARQHAQESPAAQPAATDALDEQIDALVTDGAEAIERQLRCEQLQAQIASFTPAAPRVAASDLSRETAREVIRQLRDTAAEWRAARRAWQQQSQCDPTAEEPASATVPQSTPQSTPQSSQIPPEDALDAPLRRVQLHDEIRQVKLQTRRLLQRRVLSRSVLAGIGLLFVIGVVALLSSLFLDLADFEWTVQLIGISCVVAASLLQWNLERTPTARMRQQRLRIERLLAEISPQCDSTAVRLDTRGMDSDPLPTPQPLPHGPPPEPTVDQVDRRLRQCEAWSELVTAEQRWRDVLQQHDLPPEMSPQQAVAFVRQRTASAATEPTSHVPDTWAQELAADQAWLRHWRHGVAHLLEEPLDRIVHVSPQRLLDELSACRLRRQQARRDATERTARQQARQELKILQRQWKQLSKQQQRILRRAQAESLQALREQLLQRRELGALQDQLQTVRTRLEQRLREADPTQPVREWLDTCPATELASRVQSQQVACERVELEIQDAAQQLQSAQARIAQLAQAPQSAN